jgi:hypothetical protein
MNDSIDERVYALVAEERGVRRDKLVSGTTLSHDLGMEGDDAVEFFNQFSTRFGVDLSRLDEDWNCYFGSEGVGLGGALLVVVPTFVLAVVIQVAIPKLPFWVCPVVGLVVWIGIIYYWQKTHPDRRQQIHIIDLIDSAKAGKWTGEVPDGFKGKSGSKKAYGAIDRWFTS